MNTEKFWEEILSANAFMQKQRILNAVCFSNFEIVGHRLILITLIYTKLYQLSAGSKNKQHEKQQMLVGEQSRASLTTGFVCEWNKGKRTT